MSSEGQFHRELYLRDLEILSKMFNDEDDKVNEYEDESEPTELHLHQNAVFEITEPGTFIWIKSPPNAIEPLFIAEILWKGTAEEDLRNENGHILESKMFAEINYLENIKERKKLIKYQQLSKSSSVFMYVYTLNIYYQHCLGWKFFIQWNTSQF